MNVKMKFLAVSASILAAFAAAPANATVYADAALSIQNLSITFGGGLTAGTVGVTRYTFNTSDSASLNGVSVSNSASCLGVNPTSGGFSSCNTTGIGPVVASAPSNAPGSSVTRGAGDFSFYGPAGGNQFANSAASILTSELFTPIVAGPPVSGGTSTKQIAEVQLQGNGAATANSQINSTTTVGLVFTVSGAGAVTISFSANPDLLAMVNEGANNGLFLADASTSALFSITNGTSTTAATQTGSWAPNGITEVGNAACQGLTGGLTCSNEVDSQNLNNEAQQLLGTGNGTDARSHGDVSFTPFGITISGLTTGTYTLQLTALTQANVQRIVVPEPASVALLGIGVLGLAMSRRRSAAKA